MVAAPPLFPSLWKPGARLGLFNPASPTDPNRLERGISWLESQGFSVEAAPSTQVRSGIHALSESERAAEFDRFISDPAIDGILCVRGGSGSMGILDRIDHEQVRAHPKLIVGLSDPTALLLGLNARTGLVSVTGQMVVQLHEEADPYTTSRWREAVFGPWPRTSLPLPEGHRLEVLTPGSIEGRLFPFNLSLFTSLIGTPYLPDLDGAILVLEEIDERPEGLDRMVAKIRLSGLDRRIGGVVLGQFTHCLPRNEKLTEQDGLRLVWDWARSLGIPALAGFPYGHESISCSLPVGVAARLESDPAGLTLIEGPGIDRGLDPESIA